MNDAVRQKRVRRLEVDLTAIDIHQEVLVRPKQPGRAALQAAVVDAATRMHTVLAVRTPAALLPAATNTKTGRAAQPGRLAILCAVRHPRRAGQPQHQLQCLPAGF